MIIGLSGYAQSGKDTVANALIEKHNFNRIAFADPIRTFLYEMNPMSGSEPLRMRVDVDGWDKAKQHGEVRRLLQTTGVAARKLFGEDFWVKQAFSGLDSSEHYVISDVRFKNEAETIREMGGYIWRVERTGIDAVNSHPSEHDMDDWEFDAYLANSGTIEDLAFLVDMNLRVLS